MARCLCCNIVISEHYLKDGMCEDCINKNSTEAKQLTELQLDDMLKLKLKYPTLLANEYLEKDKISKNIKVKYNIDLSIDMCLNIEKLLKPYIDILARKMNELVTVDAYGTLKYDLWYQELNYFIENKYVNLLESENIIIPQDLIKEIIISNINLYLESNRFIIENNIKLDEGETLQSRTITNILALSLIIALVFYFIYSIKNSSSNSYSDTSDYQQRYNNEKAKTLSDINKAIDEAKYQDWKHKQ